MNAKLQAHRARWKAFMARRTRVGRLSVRLLLIIAAALILRALHIARILDWIAIWLCGITLFPLLIVLFYRWVTQRLLWKVRNRLIVTYLLMGLAPVVLFATLGGIAAYLFSGQYATNTALSILDQASIKVQDETASEAAFSLYEKSRPAPASRASGPAPLAAPSALAGSRVSLTVLDGLTWRPLLPSNTPGTDPLPIAGQSSPPWLHAPFRGVVALKGKLYICSAISVPIGSTSALVLGSMPLDTRELGEMSKGLGSISLYSGFSHLTGNSSDSDITYTNPSSPAPKDTDDPDSDKPAKSSLSTHRTDGASDEDIDDVKGADLPPRTHFFDTPVYFSASLPFRYWATGKTAADPMVVKSRPSLLYANLFANSVTIGVIVRIVLISTAVTFAVIELLALLMAFGLSRTITRSVNDLYRGTREIDSGNLDHRVRVARHDQLGDLASSFNGMAASVSQLLILQGEKERLLNELMIAQEVQTTLFPHSPALLGAQPGDQPGGLEMHALCIPARTVGGDYYDFIFGSHSGLCLALGDISGKGISAALLMASLHSAVRAFSLGEESEDSNSRTQPSPALLLKLLNRHLYLSTQSARYATLFLAFYDVKTRQLTYSNGGHLPPLVLSATGKVRRLDCGGSVVGLLEDLDYLEETVQLASGDLLIAFTDGLTEPENIAAEEFGEARLLTLMQQHRDEPLPSLAANTLKILQQWIGAQEQPDDMTILLARQL